MTRIRGWLYGLCAVWALILFGAVYWTLTLNVGHIVRRAEHADGHGTIELLSSAYNLDQVYMSMQGPSSNQPLIALSERANDDETVWLTGIETQVVDADSGRPVSNEFFCHSNLTFNPETASPQLHNASFNPPTHADWRLFTLVPGRMGIHLPPGFGVPIKNATLVDHYTMTLNQNAGHPQRDVRLRTTINYQRQTPGAPNLRPLFRRALYVYQQYTDEPTNALASAHHAAHVGEFCGTTCPVDQRGQTASRFVAKDIPTHPGATCCVLNASEGGVVPQFGSENTIHWMVPPGKHLYRTDVTRQMQLPFDTTAHYITGHLHPFGTLLRLIDDESEETVVEVKSRSFDDRLGVEWMSETSSIEGIPLRRDRRYTLVAEYNNTSDAPIDAMGILYIYALDASPKTPVTAYSN